MNSTDLGISYAIRTETVCGGVGRWRRSRPGARVATILPATAMFLVLAGDSMGRPLDAAALPAGPEVLEHVANRPESPQRTEVLKIGLIEADGTRRDRTARVYRSRQPDAVRILFVFDSPPNLRDTALLIVDHDDPAKEDDRWIYLPAMRKTRRIGANERGQTFLGTDFTYEEIRNDARLQPADTALDVQGESEHAGRACLASTAKITSESYARDLGYDHMETCVDSKSWVPLTMSMFAPDGTPVKTIELADLRQEGDVWVPTRREAKAANGHVTLLETTSLDLTTPLPSDLFTEEGLRRGGR